MSEIKYNFPKMTKKISKRKQLEKISEEWIEFLTAINEEEKYIEFLDMCHCMESYSRHFMDEKKLIKAKKLVIEKNTKRGYYDSFNKDGSVLNKGYELFNRDCDECNYMLNHMELYKCPEICPMCGTKIK